MPTSTAWFISYDLRPGKQIERRVVLETLLAARSVGVKTEDMLFIGMGGVRFIDFVLAHKILGSKRFVSIEHDEKIVPRCHFNKPFGTIEIFEGTSNEFFEQSSVKERSIIWLDYESGVSISLEQDMIHLASSVQPGSFIFVTATGELPRRFRKIDGLQKRLDSVQKELGPLAANLTTESVNAQNFPVEAAKILTSALTFAFSGRYDGSFLPFLQLNYKDSIWMMTVGGYFDEIQKVKDLSKELKKSCKYLKPMDHSFVYVVEQFNITDAERRMFDRAALSPIRRRKERIKLKSLGFKDSVINQYAELMHFIPRYFESLF